MIGKRFLNIVWKEVSLIKSQKLAIILIFLFPFIAVQLFISSFSSFNLTQINEVKIGLITDIPEYSDQNLFTFGKDVKVVYFSPKDSALMISSVKNKDILAGIMISQDVSKRVLCNIYYDNTSVMSAPVIVEIASAGIQRAASKKAQDKLGEIFLMLKQMAPKIKDETQKLMSFKAQLASAEDSLNSLDNRLKSIDINNAESVVAEQRINLADANTEAEAIIKEIEDSQADFDEIKDEFTLLKDGFDTYYASLTGIISTIDIATSSINSQLVQATEIAEQLPQPERGELISLINDLNSSLTTLDSTTILLDSLNDSTKTINKKMDNIDSLIQRMDSLYTRVEENKFTFREKISSANIALDDLAGDINVLKDTFIEISTLITDAKKSREDIEIKLNDSEVLLTSLSDSMNELGSVDPGLFIEPIIIKKYKAFVNATQSGTLVSNALVIVIVLTSILLAAMTTMSERTEKAQLRLDLSQTPKFILFLGKLCGYIIVAFAESTLIIFVAALKIRVPLEFIGINQIGYGVPMTLFTLFNIYFSVALIAVAFAAIGIAVSNFSKSQSTAILASLLLVIPMLFLSGIIFPIEFMDPGMRTFSMLLPLTAANTLLTDVIARDFSVIMDIIPITVLLTVTIIAIVVVNYKKTIYKN